MISLFKKAKLHIITTVTVCGLVVAIIVPTNKKDSSTQTINQNDTVESVALNNSLMKSSIDISDILDKSQPVITSNSLEDSNSSELLALSDESNISEEDVIGEQCLDVVDDNTQEMDAGNNDTSDLLSMGELDESIAQESIGTENPTQEVEIKEDEEPAPQFYSVGVNHSSVAEIQQRLMDLGFMDYAEPTSYYGNITAESVMLFQRQNDLKQDGIIGPETKEMLLSVSAKVYTAKLGMDGNDIRRIQTRLYEMGYLASEDQITGHFGDVTESAVKKMQETNGLVADGKVGTMTVELIYSGEAKPNLISYGDNSDIVLECQKRLKELGYLTTTPDGTYGNDTSAAVKQFQSRNDLVVDGYLGPSTREVLYRSDAVPNGIMLGDNGDSVKRIQQLLIKYGYLSSGNDTGYFGEATEAAVKSFQQRNGLSADGNVGVLTMTKLTGSDVVKASTSSNSSNSNSNSGNSGNANSNSNSNSNNNSDNSSSGNSSSEDSSSNSGSTSASVSALISVAKSKLGSPYVYGSKGPNSFDCSGFVYWCLNQIGVKQSYITSSAWRNVGKYQKVSKFSNIKAGDIVVVRGHVGIAAGNGMVIDASSSSGKIVYRDLGAWWKSNFIVAWRIFD